MKWDMEQLLQPLWQGNRVYRESFMPVRVPGEALQVPSFVSTGEDYRAVERGNDHPV